MITPIRKGIAVAVASAGLACAVTAAPTLVSVPAATLDQYVGSYRYSDTTVFRIARKGDHLTVRSTGQGSPSDIYPQSEREFFYLGLGLDSSIEFGPQQAVLKQNGQRTPMPKIDEPSAAQIEQQVAERVSTQTADPRSEAALQALITDIRNGRIDDSLLAPQLVGALNKDLAKLQVRLADLGSPVRMTFKQVDSSGGDEYEVRHDRGVSTWSVVVDDRGVITGATVP